MFQKGTLSVLQRKPVFKIDWWSRGGSGLYFQWAWPESCSCSCFFLQSRNQDGESGKKWCIIFLGSKVAKVAYSAYKKSVHVYVYVYIYNTVDSSASSQYHWRPAPVFMFFFLSKETCLQLLHVSRVLVRRVAHDLFQVIHPLLKRRMVPPLITPQTPGPIRTGLVNPIGKTTWTPIVQCLNPYGSTMFNFIFIISTILHVLFWFATHFLSNRFHWFDPSFRQTSFSMVRFPLITKKKQH